MAVTTDTERQFDEIINECRSIFASKLLDYHASWRIMRPESLTDQIFIKAKRIRTLEITKKALIDEDIRGEFLAVVNYGIICLIQLNKAFADKVDIDNEEALALYDRYAKEALQLMIRKNHDYGEAWKSMRVTSFTDIILTKINRIKQIEDNGGVTTVSEGVVANCIDIINYAVFGAIKLM